MLRQVYGQRIHKDKLLRKFTNHGISSLLPYLDSIETLYDNLDDKAGVLAKAIPALEARINQKINSPEDTLRDFTYPDLSSHLAPILVQAIKGEELSPLKKGSRVRVKLESMTSSVKPGSEGFITEKSEGVSKVRFYYSTGRYGVETFSMKIPDDELQILSVDMLLDRHQDLSGIAQYFFNDSLLRAMKPSLDASVYAFAADLAVQHLTEKGFLKIDGEECAGVLERIFSVLAPKFDQTYRDLSIFSSHTLSSPPSEQKPHALRLELTTGCDYNKCTFCSEYSEMTAVTKSFTEFKEHVDRVAASIGSEKSRVQRLFIGSGNSLGVETESLLEALNYASHIFSPQRISLYGRTSSILEKSVIELKRLKEAGLSLIYWGLESGSDDVLNYISKDCTRSEMIEASQKLVEAGIEVSAMLMPGVGGLKFSEQHVVGTLELLHNIEIRYLTLLSINPSETSVYARNMAAEIDNRHLTSDEVNIQVYRLLEGLKPTGSQIGMFTEEIDQASSNTMRLNCQWTEPNKELLLSEFWTLPAGK